VHVIFVGFALDGLFGRGVLQYYILQIEAAPTGGAAQPVKGPTP
jgi:hypothetical protein